MLILNKKISKPPPILPSTNNNNKEGTNRLLCPLRKPYTTNLNKKVSLKPEEKWWEAGKTMKMILLYWILVRTRKWISNLGFRSSLNNNLNNNSLCNNKTTNSSSLNCLNNNNSRVNTWIYLLSLKKRRKKWRL